MSPGIEGPFTTSPNSWFAHAYLRTRNAAAILVGMYCWHLAGRQRRRHHLVVIAADVAWEFRVGRTTFFRVLRKLETAGLLHVVRRPRHGCLVTLPTDAEIAAWDEEPNTHESPHRVDSESPNGVDSQQGLKCTP